LKIIVVYDNRYVIFLILKNICFWANNVAATNICPGLCLFNQGGGDAPIVKQ
jgi:hypothetical protein